MLKIIVADHHAFTRGSLKNIIENSVSNSQVEEVSNGTAVYEKIKDEDFNLIILDVNITDTAFVGLVTNILALKPESKILIFSIFNEKIYAKKFLQIGAMGYLSKASSEHEIIKAIHNVLDNKKYLSSDLLETIVHEIINDKFSNPFRKLSKRELEILMHFLKGKGVTDITNELHLDSSTVGTYKARIFKKLNCNTVKDINSLAVLYNYTAILQEE